MADLYDDTGRVNHEALLQLMEAAVRGVTSGMLEPINTQLTTLSSEVKAVHDALTGNGLGAAAGLIEQVRLLRVADEENARQACEERKTLASRLNVVEQRLDRMKWTSIGIGAGVGAATGSSVVILVRTILGG